MTVHTFPIMLSTEPADLRPVQLVWLALAVFVVSVGYGALLPLLPAWLTSMMPGATASEVARHVGFLSGVYTAGVLLGAPLWGVVADRTGPGRVLIIGLVGYVASLLLMLVPAEGRTTALWCLSGAVMFVLAGFELGIVLQGQQHASLSSREIALMFAECSLVMLGVNALLFFTSLLEKTSARKLLGAVLAQHRSEARMYLGVSFTSAGTGLVLPVIAYLAAGTTRQKLGVTMGGLAAAAGLGQTLGSSAGGWLFGALAQRSFGWLTRPLVAMLILLVARSGWWPVIPAEFIRRPTGGSRF